MRELMEDRNCGLAVGIELVCYSRIVKSEWRFVLRSRRGAGEAR